VDRALRISTSTGSPATILLSFITALSAVRLDREFDRLVCLPCAFPLLRFIYEHCSFTITRTGVLWPSQLRTTCIDVKIYKKISTALHSSSPSRGLLPTTKESQGSSNSNGTVDACNWCTFSSSVALFPAKSNLDLLVGPQGRSVFGSKEKNRFPCRQLSPGSPGCIHDRSENVKPLNYKLLDILGPDDTVRHLLHHYYRTS
jgi:hypothetical protein